jgi:hypothetical protein
VILRVTLLSVAFLAIASSLAVCASGDADSKRVPAGTWGAMGIAMEVTESGARIEYDCAHGTISQPLLLDAEGRFDLKGRHFPEHGGPIREGEESRGQPVRYTGQVTGENMTLAVTPEGSDTPIGSHKLVRGKTGRIHKCL